MISNKVKTIQPEQFMQFRVYLDFYSEVKLRYVNNTLYLLQSIDKAWQIIWVKQINDFDIFDMYSDCDSGYCDIRLFGINTIKKETLLNTHND